jgi:hypothetical protein
LRIQAGEIPSRRAAVSRRIVITSYFPVRN